MAYRSVLYNTLEGIWKALLFAAEVHGFFLKKPCSRPSTQSFLTVSHILVAKVS